MSQLYIHFRFLPGGSYPLPPETDLRKLYYHLLTFALSEDPLLRAQSLLEIVEQLVEGPLACRNYLAFSLIGLFRGSARYALLNEEVQAALEDEMTPWLFREETEGRTILLCRFSFRAENPFHGRREKKEDEN